MSAIGPPRESLLILGASVRAAAFSALRAGLTPVCADLFADLDLSARCHATAVPPTGYPDTFTEVTETRPPGPWMYTGAVENYPELVTRLTGAEFQKLSDSPDPNCDRKGATPAGEHVAPPSRSGFGKGTPRAKNATSRRLLWGNDASVLKAVRDPTRVSRCLADAGLPRPECTTSPVGLPTDGSWLEKPLRSANGTGIASFGVNPTRVPLVSRDSPVYYQQRIEGLPCAAVFVGNGTSATLLGVTRQLVGEPELGAKPFTYCGSIGLLPLDATAQARFVALGHALTESFRLRGLFGVDCILRNNVPWPVEVNPRYTASVEVIEQVTGVQAIELHRQGCAGKAPINPQSAIHNPNSPSARAVGKAILYAPHDLLPPDLSTEATRYDVNELPPLADIPHPGHVIRNGHPVLTVFTTAPDGEVCRTKLLRCAADVLTACRRVAEPRVVGASSDG